MLECAAMATFGTEVRMKRGEKLYLAKEFTTVLRREFAIHRSTVTLWRWHKNGVILRRGYPGRLRLECSLVGGRAHFSLEAYERFEAKLREARE